MSSGPSSLPEVAVAIPAYNEAEGIDEFLREIDQALLPRATRLTLVVVDDASTDETTAVLDSLRPALGATLEVHRNSRNVGHGASLLEGFHRALALRPDYVLAVDGDGQFGGSDLRRVLVLLRDGAGAVCGVRRFRQDPWFRMVMTRLLRGYVRAAFGVRARDPNCPLRGFEAGQLGELLAQLPEPCLIPNMYLTVVACRRGTAMVEVDVAHRVRRGRSAQGSSWGERPQPIPWRLVRFSLAALWESLRLRARLTAPRG